jgi:hypothetical protein
MGLLRRGLQARIELCFHFVYHVLQDLLTHLFRVGDCAVIVMDFRCGGIPPWRNQGPPFRIRSLLKFPVWLEQK